MMNGYRSVLAALVVAGLSALGWPLAANAATNPTACGPLWSDPSSDASVTGVDQQDQLDVVSGGIADNGSTLTTTLTLKNLTTAVAPGGTANDYYFVFPANGGQYFTNVEVSALGVTYSYGTFDSTTGYSGVGSAAGTFNPGPNGTVTVTVPLSAVGGPSGTLSASGIYGEADELVGAPGAGGLLDTVDNDPATYDYAMGSCASPSPPSSGGSPVNIGTTAFANYGSPPGFQTRDLAQRQNAGEPSVGADWSTGNTMYMAGTQVSRIGFDTARPPNATWTDVTPGQLANASEDSILYTDSLFGGKNRTWAEDFLVNPGCNANMAYTDDDGGSGRLSTDWTPEQCPYAEGPDHPSVGAGAYAGPPPATATYPRIVYYCSQNIDQGLGAECTHSENGGLTWDPPAHIFGAGTPCGSIHGHIRVSPDGTMYVPQNSCGGGQGMAISRDNGSTFTYAVVPDSTSGMTDPSVAADAANTIYFGYADGSGHPKIAVSSNRGLNWSPSTDVGAPFNITNSKFPEVIAGDAGRAAFAFLGTTCPSSQSGCSAGDQSPSFPGVWDLYVSFTYDGGQTWHTVNATPGNPVQRGCIWNGGGSNPCRNLLDFNDITTDSHGRVYVAYTDGCTNGPNGYNCETNPAINDTGCDTTGAGTFSENASEYSTANCTYGRQSAIVRQVCGQGLIAAYDPGFSESPGCTTTTRQKQKHHK
jgi:hypothetical protein